MERKGRGREKSKGREGRGEEGKRWRIEEVREGGWRTCSRGSWGQAPLFSSSKQFFYVFGVTNYVRWVYYLQISCIGHERNSCKKL